MPASTVISTKLKITNASGTITTTQEFINADQAFVFFRDSYGNGEQDASWGDAATILITCLEAKMFAEVYFTHTVIIDDFVRFAEGQHRALIHNISAVANA